MQAPSAPWSILVCALGGEGGGVLATWLVETATRAGHAAQATSIPGVAQRTGATTYYIEIAREPAAAAPVFSLYAVPGAVDLCIASELLEAARQVSLGMIAPKRTRVIASTSRTLTTHEKMQLADGRASPDALVELLRRWSASVALFDIEAEAARAGTAKSAVMLGAIAGSGLLPFAREAYEAAIRASGKGVEASLAGFAAGLACVRGPAPNPSNLALPQAMHVTAVGGGQALPADIAARFAPAVHPMLTAGYERLCDYQDDAYARLYVDRVARIAAAERAVDPHASRSHAATREAARIAASWMAFDDVVRVAELKSRPERMARIRAEVRANAGDVVRVYDHFKPGVAEIAALLPARLAARLVRYERRRISAGKAPLGVALKLPSHSVLGIVALRALAALKRLRRHGSRFADEQAAIGRWLDAAEAGLRSDWRVGHEIVLCGALVKGYGDTSSRGHATLAHIVEHVATSVRYASAEQRAEAVRAAREAALADDAGRALDRALIEQGAPPRPVRAQPITFVRRATRKAA